MADHPQKPSFRHGDRHAPAYTERYAAHRPVFSSGLHTTRPLSPLRSARAVTRDDLLARLRALEGVTDAALVGGGGDLTARPGAGGPLALAAEELDAQLTSERVLAELLGAELPTQTVLGFGAKTVLLTQTADLGGEPVTAVLLLAAPDLNRVRFGLRRLLPDAPARHPSQPRA